MSKSNEVPQLEGVPEAQIRTQKRRISIVWLVPLVALAIGGWLVYKALSEKGPTVTITFKSADGLEAGKTKIKYKDVELGLVNSIVLSKDLSHVIVKAEFVKGSKNYLSQNTRFWVVRARVAAGGDHRSAGQPFCIESLEPGFAKCWRPGVLPADRGRSGGQLPTGRGRAGGDHPGVHP